MRSAATTDSLGYGIGLRTNHFAHLLEHGTAGVDWFEIISENFFEPGGRPWRVLEKVRAEVPVVAHGVSLSIGNAAPLNDDYLRALSRLIERVEPTIVSDHLCWGGYGGKYAHDLLPIPLTRATLEHVISRVGEVQERLRRRVLLENVSSYVTFTGNEMSEWEFIVELARRSGCGILFDVNNVYVSSRNHGFSAETYVDAIPAEAIGQVHLAGHTDKGTWLLDSHVGPVPDPVWALYARLVRRTGELPTLVEWDERIPDFATVAAEATRAKTLAWELTHER